MADNGDHQQIGSIFGIPFCSSLFHEIVKSTLAITYIDPKIMLLLGFKLCINLKTFQTYLCKEYLQILQRLVKDAKNLQILANSAKNLQRLAKLQGYICGS